MYPGGTVLLLSLLIIVLFEAVRTCVGTAGLGSSPTTLPSLMPLCGEMLTTHLASESSSDDSEAPVVSQAVISVDP